MSLIVRASWRLLAAGLLSLFMASTAMAQVSYLTLYVFNEGAPVRNIEILLDDELIGLTNERGVAELEIAPGIHYLELRMQDSVILDQQILPWKTNSRSGSWT